MTCHKTTTKFFQTRKPEVVILTTVPCWNKNLSVPTLSHHPFCYIRSMRTLSKYLQSLGRGLLLPGVTQNSHFTLICGFMFILTLQDIPIFKSLTNINHGKAHAYIYIHKQLNKWIGYPLICINWCMSEFWFNRCWFNVCLNVAATTVEATLRLKNYTCQIIHTKGKHF